MKKFEYLEAHTLRQAISMLGRHGSRAQIVAGSTDFLVRWRQGVWSPNYVVNIQRIPGLSRIAYSARQGLSLGALVTLAALEHAAVLRQRYPALSAAAATFAGVQVRNLATVGGNVANASPSGDTLPALLAFDARCRIVGPEGERWVPLDRTFTGPGGSVLGPGDVLVELRLPPPLANTGSAYIKHSPRGGMDIATVGVASAVSLQDGGRACRDVRIALGAVAPTPLRAYAAEELLRGQVLTPELLDRVAQEAQALARPIDDIRGSADHRRAIVGVLTRRTLASAIDMVRSPPMSFEAQRRLAVEGVF